MSRAERLKAMSEQRKKLRKLKPKYEIGDKVKWKTPQPILFFKEPIPEGAIFKGTVEAICKHATNDLYGVEYIVYGYKFSWRWPFFCSYDVIVDEENLTKL